MNPEQEQYWFRFIAAYDQMERAFAGVGGFEWEPGWTPGPLHELPRTVYPPFLGWRGQPDTVVDRGAALVDALHGIERGAADRDMLAWVVRVCDTPVVATLVSLLHRARLAGPIPGRARPAPTGPEGVR